MKKSIFFLHAFGFAAALTLTGSILTPLMPALHAEEAPAKEKEILINVEDCLRRLMRAKPETVAKFETDLSFSDAQKARLKEALDTYRTEMDALEKDTDMSKQDQRGLRIGTLKKALTSIEGILTPDQKSQLIDAAKQRRQAAGAKAKSKAAPAPAESKPAEAKP